MTIAANPFNDSKDSPQQSPGTRALQWGVVIVISLAMIVGGWFAWTRIFAGPTESGELDIGTIPDRFRPRGMVVQRPPPAAVQQDGIHPIGANMFRVNNGEFFMALAPVETTYAPLRLMVNLRQVTTQDELRLIRICEYTGNAGAAKTIDITPDQAKQLTPIRRQLSAGMNGAVMKISDDDHNKMRDLWKSWNDAKDPAAKNAAQVALMTTMKDVGTRSMGATKQQYADLAGQIRKIITDQQIAKYRQSRGG